MKKKLGPLPVWTWIVILAAGGYLIYKYRKSREENTGVEEGFFPTQGIPSEGIPEGGGSGLGIEGLSSAIQAIEAAGFVPAGSERAERGEGPEKPPWYEELVERLIGERLAPPATKKKTPPAHRKPGGKGKGGRKRGEHGNGAHPGKGPNTGHQPGHTQPTNHKAAAHPGQRSGKGKGGGGGGGGAGGGTAAPTRHWIPGHWQGSGRSKHWAPGHWS